MDTIEQWGLFETRLQGPGEGNPFKDTELRATFTHGERTVTVSGFYDGAGVYRIRFMPDARGVWRFTTVSNVPALDRQTGELECVEPGPDNHGPVQVFNTYHFHYADKTPYYQVGTTCYAWTHQGDDLAEQTLRTLKHAPFNKLRMCIFPKSYAYNTNEPVHYAFERTENGEHDFSRPNPAFWHNLENRILQLQELGIEADIILFHGYDRWGYASMTPEQDDRYLRYAVARLSAFRHVWWSLANEFDFMRAKRMDDWHRFFRIVCENDPYGRLCSIHNGEQMYDHTLPWVTHASVQSTDFAAARQWRDTWRKPVVFDECRYEGDVERGWGNLSAQEMTAMFWRSLMHGCYAGHGETYENPDDILWWAKGGTLHGESPARIAFFTQFLEALPEEGWQPLGEHCAGVHGRQYLYYFDEHPPATWEFDLPPHRRYRVELIDTWAMTTATLGDDYPAHFVLELPQTKYLAVRITAGRMLHPVGKVTFGIDGLEYVAEHNEVLVDGRTPVALRHPNRDIRYTRDGSEVSAQSPRYGEPLLIGESTMLRCAAFDEERKGEESTCLVVPAELNEATVKTGLQPGLHYAYYEGEWKTMPDFSALTPLRTGTVDAFHLDIERRRNYFGIVFSGYISVPLDGVYTFFVASDDGSFLIVDGTKIVDNDGQHGMKEARGQIGLAAGLHAIELPYFDYWYDNGLAVSWYHADTGRRSVAPEMLFRPGLRGDSATL